MSNVVLADANVLIALTVNDHEHHEVAHSWFDRWLGDLATCPITQGALVRFLIREGASIADVGEILDAYAAASWHRFWPDDLDFRAAMLTMVTGHRQVTDAYLVALAVARDSRLVTLDAGLAAAHSPDHVTLLASR